MKKTLILFDCDLRISDNPAFFHAVENNTEILPLFILDKKNKRELGGASKWFLHHALESFANELKEKYSLNLILKKGDSLEILEEVFSQNKFDSLHFNKLIDPYNIQLQNQIRKLAESKKVEVHFYKSQTLFDPSEIKTGNGDYFKVFTPFWKNCLKNQNKIEEPLKSPKTNVRQLSTNLKNDNLDLLPKINWDEEFKKIWEFDYKKIKKNFSNFLQDKISNYKAARDIPSLEGTSKLSPYLHFGMVSIREIFHLASQNEPSEGSKQFIAELCWREFCHHLIFHVKDLPEKNFKAKFDKFPWYEDEKILKIWQKGQTGFPIVDAGMRELWQTGWMHNRVRMIVGSFLVKDLLMDWKKGESWFWDCLVDANLANNVASWQWISGSGADAAPYFRIFNPTLQGERFDPEGEYVKKWIPELKKLPKKFIHQPWEADAKTLEFAGVELGKTYPKPILDHKKARDLALTIFKNL